MVELGNVGVIVLIQLRDDLSESGGVRYGGPLLLILYKLSFGRTDFVRTAESSLKLGLERLVALEDLLYIVFLKRFRVS